MKAIFSLGSNLGDRLRHLEIAILKMKQEIGQLKEQSSVYETDPWGKTDQPAFVNQVVIFNTKKSANQLLESVLKMELDMGRKRVEKWGPRIIDIDLLFLDDQIISSDQLQIPHPGIPSRRFVLEPLNELVPNLIHPIEKQTIKSLLNHCSDQSSVYRIQMS